MRARCAFLRMRPCIHVSTVRDLSLNVAAHSYIEAPDTARLRKLDSDSRFH